MTARKCSGGRVTGYLRATPAAARRHERDSPNFPPSQDNVHANATMLQTLSIVNVILIVLFLSMMMILSIFLLDFSDLK